MNANNIRVLVLMAGATVMTGCATQGTDTTTAELQQKERQLAELSTQLQTTESELASARAALATADSTTTAPAMTPAESTLFPPNPKPGQCYARVLIPAEYRSSTKQVMKRQASERIEIIPAKYGPQTERILIKEASTKLVVEPAVYETVTERMMVRPASSKLVEVPARYDTASERVLDKPAHTIWKRGSQAANVVETARDESTGEIMCLVEVPATYKTVSQTVLVSPARTEKVEIPAEYETVTKRVLKKSATTREVVIPAEYDTIATTVLLSSAEERRISIPAEYETVSIREKVTEEQLEWRQVLCEVNLTPANVSRLQRALEKAGYYNGPVDGILGPQTLTASQKYSRAKGLASGTNYIPVEVAKSLGVTI